MRGVGLIHSMYAAGSYSVNSSTDCSVTSLRHAAARVLPVSVNHCHESGVGSAHGELGVDEGHVLLQIERPVRTASQAEDRTPGLHNVDAATPCHGLFVRKLSKARELTVVFVPWSDA